MEDHFKNKLKNHKVDWDKKALLGNLKQELSPDEKRFDWKWLLLLPVLLLATCWGWNNLQIPTKKLISTQIENNSVVNEKENKLVQTAKVNEDKASSKNKVIEKNVVDKVIEQFNKTETEAEVVQSTSETKQELKTKRAKTISNKNLGSRISDSADLSKIKSPQSRDISVADSQTIDTKPSFERYEHIFENKINTENTKSINEIVLKH